MIAGADVKPKPATTVAAIPTRPRVFVIDDDEVMLLSCRRILDPEHYEVETFASPAAGLARLSEIKPQLILVDLKMPELDGLEVIGRIRKIDPDLVIAVITGYATIATAVDAMKAGAYDFLPKPFTPDELRVVVKRCCERWQLAEEAKRLKREKEASERRIVTFVSHQLKSPLAATKQYLDVLVHTSGDALTPTASEWIRRAQFRLEEMLSLIDDWLTLAHAERGLLGERAAASDLAPVVARVIEATAPQAERLKVSVTADIPAGTPPVRADATSLATVLTNVVTNGIKYNRPGGSVAIRATAEPAVLRILVEDTGIGIPAEDLPRIFDEFFRAARPETREISGTGLGLSICRRVLAELGGSIEATSTPGIGSTFAITIPRADVGRADTT